VLTRRTAFERIFRQSELKELWKEKYPANSDAKAMGVSRPATAKGAKLQGR
jgi:hypothetical protein